MFEIQPMSPELYRQQTRRSTFVVIAIFLVLAMLCATASTQLFGGPPGDNFKWNLLGVLSGLALTVAVVRQQLWHRPFMAAAAYQQLAVATDAPIHLGITEAGGLVSGTVKSSLIRE